MKNRKLGCFLGLAIGDAMGGPYEFLKKGFYTVSENYSKGGVFNLKKGEYTDDTSMALCLAKSLLEKQIFDPIDQLDKYSDWFLNGYMSSRGKCFDIGSTTRSSLIRFLKHRNPFAIEKISNKNKSGNGPIMKLAPIPIYFDNVDEVKLYSGLSAKTTHFTNICKETTEVFGVMLFNAIRADSKLDIFNKIEIDKINEIELKNMLNRILNKEELNVLPTGYILNSLEVALYSFFKYDNFIDGLLYVISLGEDADTVGAIYGQIAGAYYGIDNIPKYYIDNLMDSKLIVSIGEDLISEKKEN